MQSNKLLVVGTTLQEATGALLLFFLSVTLIMQDRFSIPKHTVAETIISCRRRLSAGVVSALLGRDDHLPWSHTCARAPQAISTPLGVGGMFCLPQTVQSNHGLT